MDRFKEIENDLSVRVEQLSLITIEELELAIKFNYNLGRYLWLQSKTEEAIKKLSLTIKICKEFKSTYLLADLYLLFVKIFLIKMKLKNILIMLSIFTGT